jgi:hypothetical protein
MTAIIGYLTQRLVIQPQDGPQGETMLPTIPLLLHHIFIVVEIYLSSHYLAADDFSSVMSQDKIEASLIYQTARHIIWNCEMSEKVKFIIYQTYSLSILI